VLADSLAALEHLRIGLKASVDSVITKRAMSCSRRRDFDQLAVIQSLGAIP
jgi:hypothetical protein